MKSMIAALAVLLLAVSFSPVVYSDGGHSAYDLTATIGIATCSQNKNYPDGCPTEALPNYVAQKAMDFAWKNHALCRDANGNQQPGCPGMNTQTIYLQHIHWKRPGKQDKHFDVFMQKIFAPAGSYLALHEFVFVGFQGDEVFCDHTP